MNPQEFHRQHEGELNVEVSFAEIAATQKAIQGKGKVGFRQSLLDFARLGKRQHRQQNPIAANQADIVNWVLYDKWAIVTASALPAKIQMFSVPQNANIQTGATTYTKSKVDTNMEQVQRLSDPQWFNTVGVGVYFATGDALVDIEGFMNTTYTEFWVGNKIYSEGPNQCFPSAAGLYGSTTGVVGNGWPESNNFFDLRLAAGIHLGVDNGGNAIVTDGLMGITILQGQTFHFDIKADVPSGYALSSVITTQAPPYTTTAAFSFMVYLYGILSRGVQ